MQRNMNPKRAGLLLVAALMAVTVLGHVASRGSSALPIDPGAAPPAPLALHSPAGSLVSFSGRLDRAAVHAGGDGRVMMELTLAAGERPSARGERTPTDLLVILDRSGSMAGEKIVHARAAVEELLAQLAPGDRFALVTYSDDAELAIPLTPATAAAKQRWRRLVAAVEPGGGTNMSRGMDIAAAAVRATRGSGATGRILLISDGLANQGDSSLEGLVGRASRTAREAVVLSAVGVGEGFNEVLMSAIADAGTGNYYYLRDTFELAAVFAGEFEASRETVATALAVEIESADGVRVVDAAGYPLERHGALTTFRPGSLFAGQERRIWVTLEVPSDRPGPRTLGTFRANYSDGGEHHSLTFTDMPRVACVAERDEFLAAVDKDTWARSVLEEEYNRLQQQVAGLVRSGRRDDALAAISTYQGDQQQLNRELESAEVDANLAETERLKSEVEDAFTGADQAAKQNVLSKRKQAAGWDGRRVGAKKTVTPPAPKSNRHR